MDPILLQKQLKENAADLDEFYKELKSWGDDMKRKEESQKKTHITNVDSSSVINKKGKNIPNEKKLNKKNMQQTEKTKIGTTDYSAWEKFDADAECEKIDYDENEESDLTDECDETLRDQAYVEKEKGNKFVKNEQWDEAIKSYTKAIDYYSYDPIFYANRALCYLKKQNMLKAEQDCTLSLRLDKTYVKAYQRRAAAREALNKLEEAEMDLLQVLELEPKNKESKTSLDKVKKKLSENQQVGEKVQRPVSKFTASRQQRKNASVIPYQSDVTINKSVESQQHKKEIDLSKPESYWPSGNDNILLVKTVNKPIHLRSKKPLKRIEIIETTEVNTPNKEVIIERMQVESFPKANDLQSTLKTDDLKIVEKIESNVKHEVLKETKNQRNTDRMNEEQLEFSVPKNSVQFYSQWKHLKTLENKYEYMKLVEPENLIHIFKESLESNVFSEMLEVLVKCFINNGDKVFNYLLSFTKMKRFSAIVMFMTDNDKNYVRKLIDFVTEREYQSKDEIDQLIKIFEL